MAKRKKSKENKQSFGFSVELTGLILILIGIIGFGFGAIGTILKEFSMFLAGNWYFVILIYLIIIGIYMLIKRKMPNFFTSRLVGIYFLFLVLLIATHFSFLELEESPKGIIIATYNNYMERMSTINAANSLSTSGTTSIIIGGGLTGAVFLSLFYSLFGLVGTKIVLWILGIFGFILASNITISDIVNKLKEFFTSIPKEEKEPKKKQIVVDGDGVVFDA